MSHYVEPLLTKTKIVATVGPASRSPEKLAELVSAGVDVFRLNFAHGSLDEKAEIVAAIREISARTGKPIGILGDLSGPKIRLGQLPSAGLTLLRGQQWDFVDGPTNPDARELSTSYDGLVEDLRVGDRIRLADGAVSLVVTEKSPGRATCEVEQPGVIRGHQGVNLPGSRLRIASLTDKDLIDLDWAIRHQLDFVGLSFVRAAEDIRGLRERITQSGTASPPSIIAKIEKPEAIDDLDQILTETDGVMVARGDLGVEVDIVRVPGLQKRIIAACNRRRIPVITATQMLESMIQNELPTRAEVTDVANAVLDGTDAVMLSGETAVGRHPALVVETMSRIAREAELLLESRKDLPLGLSSRTPTTDMTVAVTLGAVHAAERLQAKLLVLLTRSGATAAAVSELRSRIPVLALTDCPRVARTLTLRWGVQTIITDRCADSPHQIAGFVEEWGRERGLLASGDYLLVVGATNWTSPGKDLLHVAIVK
ncbi:MAG: pyruvate kinase [Planctomycetaceae bacterium]